MTTRGDETIIETYQSRPVQDAWPDLECYMCGPASEGGTQLESYISEDGESLVATVDPDPKYTAGSPNVAYGGFIASLVDCHSIWTVDTFAHLEEGYALEDRALEFVTGNLSVDFLAPTPLDEELQLVGRLEGEIGKTTEAVTEIQAAGETTARGDVVAVEVSGRY